MTLEKIYLYDQQASAPELKEKRSAKAQAKSVARLTKCLQTLQMGFALEEQIESSEIATENSDFKSFAELITLLTKSYGIRLFNVLLDCYVDELDLTQDLVSSLKSGKAKNDELEATRQARMLTPSKSTKQNQLNNYYSSIEPSPSSFKLEKSMSVSQRPTRTTHTQTENCYTQ